ncbi:hypothetical protein K435DRAFT_850742 [Dendrothele bispora CBS 962.96]|uniref:Uncharacterized protein n=1 Tax=Dendrothele bispora (strain CBS 962.96) TaxID=1314807 RepID=A0A4S8MP34_DENBC|nr:hypothetical protein K435DRAFT_850742 [Dendrothele bispora CBS 962.96]
MVISGNGKSSAGTTVFSAPAWNEWFSRFWWFIGQSGRKTKNMGIDNKHGNVDRDLGEVTWGRHLFVHCDIPDKRYISVLTHRCSLQHPSHSHIPPHYFDPSFPSTPTYYIPGKARATEFHRWSGFITRTTGTGSPHAGLGQGRGVIGVQSPARVVPPTSSLSESFPSVPTTALADPLMVYPLYCYW